MTRALVTGANGHIGANLVRELLGRGYEVVAMVRESSDLTTLTDLDLTYRKGDIRDEAAVEAAVEGCEIVFHTAAVYRMWAKDPAEILEPAVEGARHVFSAAKRAGVRRVVYTSSVASVGFTRSRDDRRTEEDWNDELDNPYYRAKTESERVAHRLSEETGVPVVVLCPSLVLGPWDYKITPSTRILLDWVNGSGMIWEGGLSPVHVADVAALHALAAEKGRDGARYLAVGHNLYLPDGAELLERLVGRRPTDGRRFPMPVQWLAALLSELGARITGKDPAFSRSALKSTGPGRFTFFDPSRTREELGHEPRPLEDTLRETIAWLLHVGAIKPAVARRIGEDFEADPEWLPPASVS